jgi:hypothetical protein
LRPF